MLQWMRNNFQTSNRRFVNASGLAALLLVSLFLPACVTPPSVTTVAKPVVTGQPVSLDNILVSVTSAVENLTAERQLLSESLISGLNQTEMFTKVTANPPDLGPGDGIKIQLAITAIKKVLTVSRSDDNRTISTRSSISLAAAIQVTPW